MIAWRFARDNVMTPQVVFGAILVWIILLGLDRNNNFYDEQVTNVRDDGNVLIELRRIIFHGKSEFRD